MKDWLERGRSIKRELFDAQHIEWRTFKKFPPGGQEIKTGVAITFEQLNDVAEFITWAESTYGQVSKALCGKENATVDEILQAVDQLKFRLIEYRIRAERYEGLYRGARDRRQDLP